MKHPSNPRPPAYQIAPPAQPRLGARSSIYADPGHIIAYADDEVRQEFSICFTARIAGGQLAVGDQESTEVCFVKPSELDDLPMGKSTRLRIQHFLEHRTTPYFA